jgi:hypothetical protein
MYELLLAELGIAGGIEAGKKLAAVLRAQVHGDEIDRLFTEIEERYPDVPGLTAAGLAPLRDDPAFLEPLAFYWLYASFPRDAMIEVLEQHLGETPDRTPRELAVEVADLIDRFSARARESNKELFAIEALRQTLEEELGSIKAGMSRIEQQLAAQTEIRFLDLDTAPPLIRERLRRMVEEGADDLAPLQVEIEGVADPRSRIEDLARVPPRWLEEGSTRTWEFVGEYASGYALWAAAGKAFAEAAERPGADRAGLLARAAANYFLAGDEETHRDLLSKAEQLDARNPQVILSRLRPPLPAADRLAILAEAPDDLEPRPRAAIEVARAIAHLDLHEWDEARASLEIVRANAPDHIGLRELEPVLVIAENTERGQEGRPIDVAALRQAAAETKELREDLLTAFRFGESSQLLARAATALAIVGDHQEARALLATIHDEERAHEEARVALATAALSAGDIEFARGVVPQGDDEPARLLRAEIQAGSDDVGETRQAIADLDRLAAEASDASVQMQAAFSRQLLASTGHADSNPEAEKLLREARPELEALLRSELLIREQRLDEAENALLPYTDDYRALRELARIAGLKEDWQLAAERLRDVVQRAGVAEDRLLLADAQGKAGRIAEALAALEALASDLEAPREIRTAALSYATQFAVDSLDYAAAERFTSQWLELEPGLPRAAWGRLFALHRLGRTQEARQLIGAIDLDPNREDLAELYAAVLSEGDLEVAARKIAELSDRFGRPERLEYQFLMNAVRVRPEERLADLADEIRERWAAFPERFPQSQLIQAIPIDTSAEGIEAFFAEYVVPAAEHRQEYFDKVREGDAPLASLAAALGRPLVLTTIQLKPGLPIGFRDPTLEQLELESARAAIGRAVAFDSVSLAVLALLPPEISDTIRPLLPGSCVALATMDDLHRAVENPDARGADAMLGYDPSSGRGFFHDFSEEEIAEERRLVDRAMELAQETDVRPNLAPAHSTDFDELMEGEEINQTMLSWPATLSLASREGIAVYSDDRFIRVFARRVGLQAFGTASLLDALLERGLLTDQERLDARRHLRRRGVVGLGVTLDELLEEGREVGWRHEPEFRLAFPLIDQTAWRRPAIAETVRMWGAVLRTIFDEAPEQFDGWVARVIDAGKQANPSADYSFFAETLILNAWRPFENPEFLQALIAAVREMKRKVGWRQDPIDGIRVRLRAIAQASDVEERGIISTAFLREVSFRDQLRLFGIEI